MKTCPYCQAQIDDRDAVCPYCGQFQYDSTQQSASAETDGMAWQAAPEPDNAEEQFTSYRNSEYSGSEYSESESNPYQGYTNPESNAWRERNTQTSGRTGLSGSSRVAGLIAYLTWPGFLIAFLIGDRKDPFTRFHLNQALVLNLASLAVSVAAKFWSPFDLLDLVLGVFWLIAFVKAIKGEMYKVPYLGDIRILH